MVRCEFRERGSGSILITVSQGRISEKIAGSQPSQKEAHTKRRLGAGRERRGCARDAKTYNSGYSLVVTHLTTNPPVRCLNRAERTGSLVFNVLWSYVISFSLSSNITLMTIHTRLTQLRYPAVRALKYSQIISAEKSATYVYMN